MAAAGLVDHGGEFYGVENFFDGVADGEYEAGRKLAELGARVHQRGRIGQEAPIGHHVVEGTGQRVGFPRGLFVFGFLGGYGRRYAPEESGRVLDALAVFVLAVIALGKDFFRIGIDNGGVRLRGIFIMVAPALFVVLTGSPRYAVGKEKAISGNGAGTGTTAHFWKNRQEKNFYGKTPC